MKVRLCSTIIRPRYVKVASESTSDTHTVIPSTIWNDPICTCPGFRFRETCKHVTNIEEARCDWIDKSGPPTPYQDKPCPNCGEDTMIFDLEPELDDAPQLWTPQRVWCSDNMSHGPHFHPKTGEFCRGLAFDRT